MYSTKVTKSSVLQTLLSQEITEKTREKKRKEKENLAMTPTIISNSRFRPHKNKLKNNFTHKNLWFVNIFYQICDQFSISYHCKYYFIFYIVISSHHQKKNDFLVLEVVVVLCFKLFIFISSWSLTKVIFLFLFCIDYPISEDKIKKYFFFHYFYFITRLQ